MLVVYLGTPLPPGILSRTVTSSVALIRHFLKRHNSTITLGSTPLLNIYDQFQCFPSLNEQIWSRNDRDSKRWVVTLNRHSRATCRMVPWLLKLTQKFIQPAGQMPSHWKSSGCFAFAGRTVKAADTGEHTAQPQTQPMSPRSKRHYKTLEMMFTR